MSQEAEDFYNEETNQSTEGDIERRLIEVHASIKAAESVIENLRDEYERLKLAVRDKLIDEGTQSKTIYVDVEVPDGNGGYHLNKETRRLTLAKDSYPRIVNPELFEAFMERTGTQHLKTVNAKKLQGFVNHELQHVDPEAHCNPASIGLDAFEKPTLRITKG